MQEINALGVSFFITYLGLTILIRVAGINPVFEKSHLKISGEVISPRMGGVGIILGFLLTFSLLIYEFNNSAVLYFALAIFLQLIIGLKKELIGISNASFFWGQFFVASVIVVLGGFRITNLGGFFGVVAIPELLSVILSYITVFGIVALFNFTKGMDEIAAITTLFSMLFFGIYFFINGEKIFTLIGLAMVGCLAAYLIYKFGNLNEFLGFSGLLFMGIVNAGMVLKFIAYAPTALYSIQSKVAVVVAILIIPILNAGWNCLNYFFQKKSTHKSSRKNLQSLIIDKGFCQKKILVAYFIVGLFFISFALLLDRLINPSFSLAIVLSAAFVILGWLYKTKRNNLIIASKQLEIKEVVVNEEKRREYMTINS